MSKANPSVQHEPFSIAGHTIRPGKREYFDLEMARLPTDTGLTMPVCVMHGMKPGPVLWINAAIHGDEINGVEVIRRLIAQIKPRVLAGTVVAVPIVNVFGFINQSRYLPDRRDLNRSFPGSARGSMASRIADLFLNEIVARCDYGIDMHTGANHRSNLPQIRADFKVDPRARALAEAFSPLILIQADTKDGSLRDSATEMGKTVLLYEAGEPSRFNKQSIDIGVEGVLRVMDHLGMMAAPVGVKKRGSVETPFADKTTWVRAKRSGILRLYVDVGDMVVEDDTLGVIADAFDREHTVVKAPMAGMVSGITKLPLLNQGDAVLRIAGIANIDAVNEKNGGRKRGAKATAASPDAPPVKVPSKARHTIYLQK